MAVPLGHRNHRSYRNRKPKKELTFKERFPKTKYKIVNNRAALSFDGKMFYGLHEDFDGDFRLQKTVTIIKRQAFWYNKTIRYIFIPPYIELESKTFRFKQLLVFFEIRPHISDLAGKGYTLLPKKIVKKTRASLKEWRDYLEDLYNKNKLTKPVKDYLVNYHVFHYLGSTIIEPLFIDCEARCVYSKNERVIKRCLVNDVTYRIQDGIERIDDSALSNLELETLYIPSSVKELGFCVCEGIEGLKTVYFEGVPNIDNEYADPFEWVYDLQSIYIPKGTLHHFKQILPFHVEILKELE